MAKKIINQQVKNQRGIARHTLLILTLIVILSVIILSGCSNSNNPNPNSAASSNAANPNFSQNTQGQNNPGQNNRGPNGRMMNLTDEQRQQLIEQRIQTATVACDGLSENDSCAISTPRGNTTGTCTLQNNTLMCSGAMGRGQFPNGGQYPGGPGSGQFNRTRNEPQ